MGFFEKWKEIINDNEDEDFYGNDSNDYVEMCIRDRCR